MRASQKQQSSIGGAIGTLVDTHYRDRARLYRLRELGQIVASTANLIHELQKERGLSSGWLAGAGVQFDRDLQLQTASTDKAHQTAASVWEARGPEPQSSGLEAAVGEARAHLEVLPALRRDVRNGSLTPASAIQRFSILVDRLLVVVAEAPGTSPHPQVTLALIALFNFVLAKEYTGQERALGSAVCAQGAFEPFQAERFQMLRHQREEAHEVFGRHASGSQRQSWQNLQNSAAFASLESLRKELILSGEGASVRLPAAQTWFNSATAVIDLLKGLETELLSDLDHLCVQVLAEARSAWEESQERPDERDRLSLARLERQQLRILEERQEQRRIAKNAPPLASSALQTSLAAESASVLEEARRWRQELELWAPLVRQVGEASQQMKIFSLDALIPAFSQAQVAGEAKALAAKLADVSNSLLERLESLRASSDRSVSAWEEFHGFALQITKTKESS